MPVFKRFNRPECVPMWTGSIPRALAVATLAAITLALLSACQPWRGQSYEASFGLFQGPAGPLRKGGGRAVVGRPYWIFGRRYTPHRDPTYDRIGIGSWVDESTHGSRTANGELNDTTALVAAHPTLPLPSYAEVTNLSNGCRLFLRLNDRGPFVPGRIIDMSPRAAKLLRFYRQGLTRVRLRYWGPAPINGDDSFERQYLNRYPDLGCRQGAPPYRAPNLAPYRSATASSYQPAEPWVQSDASRTSRTWSNRSGDGRHSP